MWRKRGYLSGLDPTFQFQEYWPNTPHGWKGSPLLKESVGLTAEVLWKLFRCIQALFFLYLLSQLWRNFWYPSHLLQQSQWWKTFEFSHFKDEYFSCAYFAKSLSTISIWVMVWNLKEGFFFFFFARLIFHYQVRSAQDFKVKQREHYRSITGSRVTTIQEAFLAVPIQGCSFDSVPASVPPFAG